ERRLPASPRRGYSTLSGSQGCNRTFNPRRGLMRTVKIAIATAAAAALIGTALVTHHAEAAGNKEAKVRELLQLTGAEEIGNQILDTMLAQFDTNPQLPPGFTA